MTVLTKKFGASKFDYPEVELKKGGFGKSTVKPEDEEREDAPEVVVPEMQPPVTNTDDSSANKNLQNPVSFNNTFLDQHKNQQSGQQTPVPAAPPVPKPSRLPVGVQ